MWEHAELAEDMAIDELAFDLDELNNNDLAMCYNNAKKNDLEWIEVLISKRNFICKCWHKIIKSKKWKYYCNNHCYK